MLDAHRDLPVSCNPNIAHESQLENMIKPIFEKLDHFDQVTTFIVRELLGPETMQLYPGNLSPEKQKHLESIVKAYVKLRVPIPVLCAFGLKIFPYRADFAEAEAVRVLYDLNNRVKVVYSPGCQVVVRLEDVVGMLIIPGANEQLRSHFAEYCSTVEKIAEAMRRLTGDNNILVKRETSMLIHEEFMDLYKNIAPVFLDYIMCSPSGKKAFKDLMVPLTDETEGIPPAEVQPSICSAAEKKLVDLGWKGGLEAKSIAYFLRCYLKRYPSRTSFEYAELCANYFACILTRRILKGMGAESSWAFGRIDLSFMDAIPGSEAMEINRVWYKFSANAPTKTPFWRAVSVSHPTFHPGLGYCDADLIDPRKYAAAATMSFEIANGLRLPVKIVSNSDKVKGQTSRAKKSNTCKNCEPVQCNFPLHS